MAKRDGSVCGLRVVVMRENKFGGEEGELGSARVCRLGLWWWCFDSRRKEIQPDSLVLFCELHLGLTELDMRVRLFFHCWTMQSRLS